MTVKEDRKKVLFLTTSYPLYPDAVSGIFIRRLVDALRTMADIQVVTPDDDRTINHSSTVHAFRYAPKQKQLLAHSHGGIPSALGKSRTNYLYAASLVTCFFAATIRLSISSHLLHANWSVPGAIAGVVGRIFRKPVLTTLRGEDITRAKTSRLFKLLLFFCLASNRIVVCVSSDMQAELQALFPRYRNKIRHIANGVDPAFGRPDATHSETPLLQLLCVGSLIPRKNFSCVLKAIGQSSYRERIHLTIAGEGPEREKLESLAAILGIQHNVRLLGAVSPERITDLYHRSHIFIIPSVSEGRPNVLLEAMTAGLAILAANIVGITELIDDGASGHLFAPHDTNRLTQLIDNLIEQPESRYQLGNNARLRIQQENITWERTAELYYQLYRSLTE